MPIFEESGLRVALPAEGSFRFADIAAYRRVSGQAVSEMDVGWLDRDRLILLELKDYSEHESRQDLRAKLVAKGRDSLVMLHAVWRDLGDFARALGSELPPGCRAPQKLLLVFVLKTGAAGVPGMGLRSLKEDVQSHISAYAEILGVRSLIVLLLDHHKAIEKGLVSLVEPPPAG
jgi:hypothetical protein